MTTNKLKIDNSTIEEKWRKRWLEEKIYQPNIANPKSRKFYNLMMFPYPSAEGLHVGNMYAFTGTDIYGRFQRMQGNDVLEPIGLDGFGIHSENYAIKVGRHPKEHAKVSEKNFYDQLSKIGNGFSWDTRLETYDPEYYKWTQWLFIKLFKAGLAYKSEAMVNWCPSCKTVLSDEQVEDGKCERCKHEVERKQMSSWFASITKYADRLLDNLEKIDWPEKIKIAQKQWIGRKEGINIEYPIKGSNKTITCFTTRPDTNYGATFLVVSPEYANKNLLDLVDNTNKETVSKYIKESLNKSDQQRKEEGSKKTGVNTGLFAINRLNNEELPVWVSDFVLEGFGTGAVVGVPGHDKRDFEFAQEFDLPIKRVVISSDDDTSAITEVIQVYEDEGVAINSDFLDGKKTKEAMGLIMDYLEQKGWGKRDVSYHLRDWGISRQRYWGPPIPMIHCDKCGWVAEKEENLPVLLPDIDEFKPKGDGTSPLSNAPDEWKYTECPECGAKAERELDVSDTFLDSSWYFLAYPNLDTDEYKNGYKTPFDSEITKTWLPVDAYIGGAEHAVLHLLYSRFIWMVLKDEDLLADELGDEPFPFLFSHGLIIKDGAKMSKSKGNVINPDEYIAKYGADAFRAYLMFLGPFEGGGDFSDSGIEGMRRFLDRLIDLYASEDISLSEKDAVALQSKLHKTIKKVTEDINSFKYNTAIAAMMELSNLMRDFSKNKNSEGDTKVWIQTKKVLTQLIAPFAPFIAEEFWVEVLGEKFSVHNSKWPEYDKTLIIDDSVNMIVQVNGKLRANVEMDKDKANDEAAVRELVEKEDNVAKYLTNEPKKVIFVAGKIINYVV